MRRSYKFIIICTCANELSCSNAAARKENRDGARAGARERANEQESANGKQHLDITIYYVYARAQQRDEQRKKTHRRATYAAVSMTRARARRSAMHKFFLRKQLQTQKR